MIDFILSFAIILLALSQDSRVYPKFLHINTIMLSYPISNLILIFFFLLKKQFRKQKNDELMTITTR